jgi:hypothetical protein
MESQVDKVSTDSAKPNDGISSSVSVGTGSEDAKAPYGRNLFGDAVSYREYLKASAIRVRRKTRKMRKVRFNEFMGQKDVTLYFDIANLREESNCIADSIGEDRHCVDVAMSPSEKILMVYVRMNPIAQGWLSELDRNDRRRLKTQESIEI